MRHASATRDAMSTTRPFGLGVAPAPLFPTRVTWSYSLVINASANGFIAVPPPSFGAAARCWAPS
jgi:hypothetical protein